MLDQGSFPPIFNLPKANTYLHVQNYFYNNLKIDFNLGINLTNQWSIIH
jgi:hypothetical protein